MHRHRSSEEYYFLLQGQLQLAVAESVVTLCPQEILVLKPEVPHAVVAGEGLIEHFGIRVPALCDKETLGAIPARLAQEVEEERELRRGWGLRIPLRDSRNQNCWLIGAGTARFESHHLILAFLSFSSPEAANAGMGTRHRLHFHQRSWEYYAVFKGTKTLQIGKELVTIEAGEMLEIPPGIPHTLQGRQAPYQGFTLRVPVELHDKVECPLP